MTAIALEAPPFPDLFGGLADELVAEVEAWLAAQRRTAHPLVTATTEELVAQALASLPARAGGSPTADPLPTGLWRVLPDRLLALHPRRRAERVDRLWVSVAEHLELTALLLERWGWAQTGSRIRTGGGRRCILGAQRALYTLGYGDEDTAIEAGRRIQAVLAARGEHRSYPEWNDQPHITRDQVLRLVREAGRYG